MVFKSGLANVDLSLWARPLGWVVEERLTGVTLSSTHLFLNLRMIYTVYILICADKSYYTGVTNDIDRRVNEHQLGSNSKAYTFTRRPVKVVFQEHFKDVNQAIAFEKQVKGWRRAKKEALIQRKWSLLPPRNVALRLSILFENWLNVTFLRLILFS